MLIFLQRMIGASALDAGTFEDVEADTGSTPQAMAVVVLSALAAGVGAFGFSGHAFSPLFVATLALLAWAAWALLTFEIGSRLLPEAQTRVDLGQLLRTLGFASAPGVIRVLGIVPGLAVPSFVVSAIWMLAATVVAVRQALDYKTTGRAIAVCGLGWLLTLIAVVVIGLMFSPPVS